MNIILRRFSIIRIKLNRVILQQYYKRKCLRLHEKRNLLKISLRMKMKELPRALRSFVKHWLALFRFVIRSRGTNDVGAPALCTHYRRERHG